jgi:hypothetical protein
MHMQRGYFLRIGFFSRSENEPSCASRQERYAEAGAHGRK